MKKANKKKVFLSIGIVLLVLTSWYVIHELSRSVTVDDLDPEDYNDLPDLKEIIIASQDRNELGRFLQTSDSLEYSERDRSRVVYALIAILRTEPTPKATQFLRYLWLLIRYSAGDWRDLLDGSYYHDDMMLLRNTAIEQLGYTGDKEAIDPIFQLLVEPEDNLDRKEIVFALAKLGDRRSIPYLKEIVQEDCNLENCVYRVFLSAVEAIRYLKDFGVENPEKPLNSDFEKRTPYPDSGRQRQYPAY
jgi:HEAT repeat protein